MQTDPTEAVEPCPFCGGEGVIDPSHEYVTCRICLADGPVSAEAIAAWNTRATTQAPTDDDARRLRELAVLMRNGHEFTEGKSHAVWIERIADRLAALPPAGGVEERLREIADRLVDQQGEPWNMKAGNDAVRVHYWRDKAINAANEIRTTLNSASPKGGEA